MGLGLPAESTRQSVAPSCQNAARRPSRGSVLRAPPSQRGSRRSDFTGELQLKCQTRTVTSGNGDARPLRYTTSVHLLAPGIGLSLGRAHRQQARPGSGERVRWIRSPARRASAAGEARDRSSRDAIARPPIGVVTALLYLSAFTVRASSRSLWLRVGAVLISPRGEISDGGCAPRTRRRGEQLR